MICKITSRRSDGGTSFRGLVSYMEKGKNNNSEKTAERVLCTGRMNMPDLDLAEEMKLKTITTGDVYETMWLTSLNNKNVADPVVHGIISWREGEVPTEKQMKEAVEIWLKEHNYSECQTFWAAHKDTNNTHIHVCVNRVDPVTYKPHIKGWYKKANERAARKIEIAQGWEVEQTGHLAKVVTDKDGKIRIEDKNERREERAISDKAREIENRTGEKSAERLAKELAAPILLGAQSWTEAHQQLAERGIEIKPKGSGGVLLIGGTPVKLSAAGRSCAWKRIVERLGEYEEKEPSVTVKDIQPQSIDQNDGTDHIAEYNAERRKFYEERKRLEKETQATLRKKLDELAKEYAEKRAALKKETWKGRGNALNERRAALKKEYDMKVATARAAVPKQKRGRFIDYEDWLRKNGMAEEAEIWHFRQSKTPMFLGVTVRIGFKYLDMPDFALDKHVQGGRKIFSYINEAGNVAFRDVGRHIDVLTWQDKEAVRQSLKLAAAKWGEVKVNGNDDFRSLVVELAAEENIELKNPELAAQVEKRKKEIIERDRDRGAGAENREAGTEEQEPSLDELFAKYEAARAATEAYEIGGGAAGEQETSQRENKRDRGNEEEVQRDDELEQTIERLKRTAEERGRDGWER